MSIYKEYRREPSIPHQCMHHRYKTGERCRGRAMHNEVMCFQHRIEDLPTVLQNDPFELTSLYDRASIQKVVTEVAARLACNHMDLKRAALLLQSCQIAAANLTAHDRAARAAALAPKTVAPPLTPPAQELDPNPDPEALIRYQTHQAELGLDEEEEEPAPATQPGAPHLGVPGQLAGWGERLDSEMWDQTTTDPVILSERSESKDPDEPQSASTPDTILPKTPDPQPPTDNEQQSTDTILPNVNASAAPNTARSAVHSTRKRHTPHAKRPTRHEVPPSTPQPPSNLTHVAPATTPHPANQPLPPQPAPPEPKSPAAPPSPPAPRQSAPTHSP